MLTTITSALSSRVDDEIRTVGEASASFSGGDAPASRKAVPHVEPAIANVP